jgi:hypothetical protein
MTTGARAGVGVSTLGPCCAALCGAPAWLTASIIILGLIMMFVSSVLSQVMPQASAHRLQWWNDRFGSASSTRPDEGEDEMGV